MKNGRGPREPASMCSLGNRVLGAGEDKEGSRRLAHRQERGLRSGVGKSTGSTRDTAAC